MHGEKIGIGQTPIVAISYMIVAILFAGCARFVVVAPKMAEEIVEPEAESLPA
jgi:hypothetical protein